MTDEPDREGPVAGPGWLVSGLEDDIRPHMFAAADRGEPFALNSSETIRSWSFFTTRSKG